LLYSGGFRAGGEVIGGRPASGSTTTVETLTT